MRKVNLLLLVVGVSLGISAGHAGGVLQGLEMDVMDAGETASQATSRIKLPRAGAAIIYGQSRARHPCRRPGRLGDENLPLAAATLKWFAGARRTRSGCVALRPWAG